MPLGLSMPPSITTESFLAAKDSLMLLQAWLMDDPNHKVMITAKIFPESLGYETFTYEYPMYAIDWVDGVLSWIGTFNIQPPVIFSLVYQDMSIVPILDQPARPPEPKELPDSLKTTITTSSGDLTAFANALYSWSSTGGSGCVTAVCQLSPMQTGFANTFNAPDLNSLTSWISGVQSYMAGGGTYTAAIVVTPVVCGTTGFGDE
jgi:hypothetical protein